MRSPRLVTSLGARSRIRRGLAISVLSLATLATPAASNSARSDRADASTFQNTTGPLFDPAVEVPLGANHVAIADLNQDDNPDLIAITGSIVVLLRDGAGRYTQHATIPSEDGPKWVAVGDLNRDGHADLVVSLDGPGGVSVFLGDGTGSFGLPSHFSTSNCCGDHVWLQDLDADGNADAVVVNSDDPFVSLLFGDGQGGFGIDTELRLDGYSDWAALSDFNLDGSLDLAATNTFAPEVRVFLGNGDGTFAEGGDVTIGSPGGFLAAGDVNSDGWPDLIVGFGGGNSVLLNERGRGFSRSDLPMMTGAVGALADLDGDGNLDAVTVDQASSGLAVFLGRGDGTFVKEGDYATSAPPSFVTVGDLNADGLPDLAVTSSSSISLFLNRRSVPTDNLCLNSSFETSLAGWTGYAASRFRRLETSGPSDDRHVADVRGPASLEEFGINDSPGWVRSTVAAGVRYRISADVRSEHDHGQARIRLREYQERVRIGSAVSSPDVALSPRWERIVLDYVTRAGGSMLDLQVLDRPAGPRENFQIDHVEIHVVANSGALETVEPEAPNPAAMRRAGIVGPAVSPNPSTGAAILRFTNGRSGRLRISLYDVNGKVVRTLADGQASAGAREYRIDRGEGRARLARGVYFYRVEAPEGVFTGRVVLLGQ